MMFQYLDTQTATATGHLGFVSCSAQKRLAILWRWSSGEKLEPPYGPCLSKSLSVSQLPLDKVGSGGNFEDLPGSQQFLPQEFPEHTKRRLKPDETNYPKYQPGQLSMGISAGNCGRIALHTGTISFWKRTTTSSSGRVTRLGRWQQSHLMPLQTMYQATTCTSKFTFPGPRCYKEFSELRWVKHPTANHLQAI